jgi:hypothetical protein
MDEWRSSKGDDVMTDTDINYYIVDDTTIVKYHITVDNELDYTTYTELDGGRLDLPWNYDTAYIESLLEDVL